MRSDGGQAGSVAEHINRNLDEYAKPVIEIADKYVVLCLLHELERAISIRQGKRRTSQPLPPKQNKSVAP